MEMGFLISGVSAGDRSGLSVNSAGDVNGDGPDDLIIGAPVDNPNMAPTQSWFHCLWKSGAAAVKLSEIEKGSEATLSSTVSVGDESRPQSPSSAGCKWRWLG